MTEAVSELVDCEFVVLEKVRMTDDKIGARIVPLALFKAPGQVLSSSIFDDQKYLIGGVYAGKARTDTGGKIERLTKNNRWLRMQSGDWDAARLGEQTLTHEDNHKRSEKKARAAAKTLVEIDRLGALVAKLPANQRWTAAQTIASLIMEASRKVRP